MKITCYLKCTYTDFNLKINDIAVNEIHQQQHAYTFIHNLKLKKKKWGELLSQANTKHALFVYLKYICIIFFFFYSTLTILPLYTYREENGSTVYSYLPSPPLP